MDDRDPINPTFYLSLYRTWGMPDDYYRTVIADRLSREFGLRIRGIYLGFDYLNAIFLVEAPFEAAKVAALKMGLDASTEICPRNHKFYSLAYSRQRQIITSIDALMDILSGGVASEAFQYTLFFMNTLRDLGVNKDSPYVCEFFRRFPVESFIYQLVLERAEHENRIQWRQPDCKFQTVGELNKLLVSAKLTPLDLPASSRFSLSSAREASPYTLRFH